MRPDLAYLSPVRAARSFPEAWRQPLLALAVSWLLVVALLASDWLRMADQWWNSSTYNHILFVPLIFGWLVGQRLSAVLTLTPRAWHGGLIPVALSLTGWVLGTFAGFDLLRQAGAVALLPSFALLVLGPRVFLSLLFPMAYLAFLVPFGDELVPALQTLTAHLTIALVEFSRIPATINGVFIDTPAGLFEVAEACSGVKFLIAMVALGTLVANVGFRSWRRRVAFLALCVVVPILANGIRAWGTIFAAQYVGIEKAAGIDHLVYGWVFFALVIAAVLLISWRYFDRSIDEPMIDVAAIVHNPRFAAFERGRGEPVRPLLAAGTLMLVALGWSAAAQALSAPLPSQVFLPNVAGWTRVDYAPKAAWEPRAKGADHRLLGSYAAPDGSRVDVFYALYAAQREGAEAGGFGEGALRPGSGWSWTSSVAAAEGARGERIRHEGAIQRTAWTWYRTGDLLTGSTMRLKLAAIVDRLFLRARPTAVLILSSEAAGSENPTDALVRFHSAIGGVGPWMDRLAQGG